MYLKFLRSILLLSMLFFYSCQNSWHEKNSYKIGYDSSLYPLNLMGKNSAIYGFTADFLSEISKEEKVNLELIESSWNLLFLELSNHNYDAIISSIDPNEITSSKYSFSEPILLLGPVLVVEAHSKISSLKEMKMKTIGVIESTKDELIAQQIPNVVIKRYERPAVALEDLAAGQIDGVLLAQLEALSFTQDLYFGILKIVSTPLNQKGLRLVTLKDRFPQLIESFNEGLSSIKDNKSYSLLLKKWNLHP